jgi:hypothetical protein
VEFRVIFHRFRTIGINESDKQWWRAHVGVPELLGCYDNVAEAYDVAVPVPPSSSVSTHNQDSCKPQSRSFLIEIRLCSLHGLSRIVSSY